MNSLFFRAIIGACFAVLISASAFAQGVDQPCGVGGVAKGASGAIIQKTDDEARAQNVYVKADGHWWTCPGIKYVPPPAPPQNCFPENSGFKTWTVSGNTCTTASKYASSSTDPARDRVIKHRQTAIWNQWTGSMRGQLIERCDDGVRKVTGSTCAPVTHCDNKFSTTNDGGLTNYVYDARPRDKRVPVGAEVMAVSEAGKTLKLRCVNGDLKRIR